MNKLITSKRKKVLGLTVIVMIMTGIISTAVFASQGLDTVQKNVLVSEQATVTPTVTSEVPANDVVTNTPPNNDVNPTDAKNKDLVKIRMANEQIMTSPIELKDVEKFVQIAKDSLKKSYDINIDDYDLKMNFIHNEYDGEVLLDYYLKIYWYPVDLANLAEVRKADDGTVIKPTATKPYMSCSVVVNEKTSEVISVSYYDEYPDQDKETITLEDAKNIASNFLTKSTLIEGTSIKNITVYLGQKKVAIVKVELANGNNAQVIVNTVTGRPVDYTKNISEDIWNEMEKSTEDNKRP